MFFPSIQELVGNGKWAENEVVENAEQDRGLYDTYCSQGTCEPIHKSAETIKSHNKALYMKQYVAHFFTTLLKRDPPGSPTRREVEIFELHYTLSLRI